MQGNGVSLTRLLRSSKLALIEFFGKAQKWADMSNVKPEFRQKIDLLERNFGKFNFQKFVYFRLLLIFLIIFSCVKCDF